MIDLAIATDEYGRETGRLCRVVDRYESLEDPVAPIRHTALGRYRSLAALADTETAGAAARRTRETADSR